MFDRILYADDKITVSVGWLGLGALKVRAPGRSVRRAHPKQKQFFRTLSKELARLGHPISADSAAARAAMREFAHLLMEHSASGLTWQIAFIKGGASHAAAHVQSFRPTMSDP